MPPLTECGHGLVRTQLSGQTVRVEVRESSIVTRALDCANFTRGVRVARVNGPTAVRISVTLAVYQGSANICVCVPSFAFRCSISVRETKSSTWEV